MLLNGTQKVKARWASLRRRKYLGLQYASLSLITALLLIGPFWVDSLADLLIFCGGWSNFVAFYAILRAFKDTGEKRVRAVLLIQSFVLILILGFDLNRWLGHKWLLAAVFIPITLLMWLILSHVFRAKPAPGAAPSHEDLIKLAGEWDAIIPPFFLVLSLLTVINIDPMMTAMRNAFVPFVASHVGLPESFIDARDHVYLHLLFIPVVYLVSDLLTRRYSVLAERSIPLDVIIVLVGTACCSGGLASFRHAASHSMAAPTEALYESGAVAAVLLLGNWMFSLYVERLEAAVPETTT